MKNEKNSNLVLFLVLTVFLGLISGAVSSFIIRSYALGDIFGFQFLGEMNLANGDYRGSNLVISGAKKVVVEQNDKIAGTIDAAKSGLVGIFRKKISDEKTINSGYFNPDNYYEIGEEIAQGLIITSDGWVLTDFKPEDLNYVIITNDKKIFSIDKIIDDTLTPFHFLHVNANDLPVKKLTDIKELRSGEIVLAVDWSGKSKVTYISDMGRNRGNSINFSDAFYRKIVLADDLNKDFGGLVFFNLSGDVVGLSVGDKKIEPMAHFESAIRSLLKNGVITRPSFGLNYIDLSGLVGTISADYGQGKYISGALAYGDANGVVAVKNSAAGLAGIKKGDVITAIDNIEINESISLSEAIQKFSPGDKVIIVLERNGEKKEIETELK